MKTAGDVSTRHDAVEEAVTARGIRKATSMAGTPPGIADPDAAGAPMPTAAGQGAAS